MVEIHHQPELTTNQKKNPRSLIACYDQLIMKPPGSSSFKRRPGYRNEGGDGRNEGEVERSGFNRVLQFIVVMLEVLEDVVDPTQQHGGSEVRAKRETVGMGENRCCVSQIAFEHFKHK